MTKNKSENILYVGGFLLPDLNAAAQRVVGIARGLRALGHEVCFLNYSQEATCGMWKDYFGFQCYEAPVQGMYRHLTDISNVINLVSQKKITSIIAYNYPAFALWRLQRYCKKAGIRCFADVTEWYVAWGNPLFRLIKTIDTECRMRFLHKRMDGVIAISEYLYNYYCAKVKSVKIPPTVDWTDEKWQSQNHTKSLDQQTVFAYTGKPSALKERLDLIVDAIEHVGATRPVQLRVVGTTKDQYEQMYKKSYQGKHTIFLGRLDHQQALREVAQADWAIVIRENNLKVKAGFPTKVVESITCGTPVIANAFSNITDYLDDHNSILCSQDSIAAAIEKACENREMAVNKGIFDYTQFLDELEKIMT